MDPRKDEILFWLSDLQKEFLPPHKLKVFLFGLLEFLHPVLFQANLRRQQLLPEPHCEDQSPRFQILLLSEILFLPKEKLWSLDLTPPVWRQKHALNQLLLFPWPLEY